MRTLAVSSELQLELGLDLELNTEDVAAAEAAVAAHIDESLICSCCSQVLTDKLSLHLHQISRHSLSELSLALLAVRGFNVKLGLQGIEQEDLCCQDNDSESTASAHSPFMCGFMDDIHNSSHNMVGDVGASNPSELDVKLNNNTISDTSSMPASQFPLDNARKTRHEWSGKASQPSNAARTSSANRASSSSGKLAPLQTHRSVALDAHRNPSEITTVANRKTKNRPKRGTTNNGKQVTKPPSRTIDEVIDLTSNSKRPPAAPKPDSRFNKESACRDGSNGGIEERKFSCDICGRRYKKKSHLGRHTRMHSGIRPFPCTVCDKRFAVRSILKQHLRVHTGERPFKCLYCLQRFPQKSGLVTHMMLHTGKPYKCDWCTKSFVSNHKLVVHKRAHDEQSGRLPSLGPHSCRTCATRFFTTSALWEHRKVHNHGPAAAPDTSSLTTAKSSANSINFKVSAIAPAESSLADHLTATLEFTQDISPERDDGKKSESGRNTSRSAFRNVNGNTRGHAVNVRMDGSGHISPEMTASQALSFQSISGNIGRNLSNLRIDVMRRHSPEMAASGCLPVEVNTRNLQEVTASRALLTLMDSSSQYHGDRDVFRNSEGEFSEDQLNSPEFEFCDLKSSIDLKEEGFDFENENLDGGSNCSVSGDSRVRMIVS